MRIAFLKSVNKVGQSFCGDEGFVRSAMGVLGIADLKQNLIKRLLLLASVYMFVVVFNAAVFSFLLGVILI